MRTLRERWMRFWFEPVEPLNLGLCRILFFGAFFMFYLRQDFSGWAEVPDIFWRPVWLFEILHLPVLPEDLIAMLQTIWKASLALSCIGLFTRASTVCSFVLGAYLIGLPNNFGTIHHADALVVIVLGIMALSRCGDSCSIDRLIQRTHRSSNLSERIPLVSGEYTWPVRAVWLMFALIFFAAGATKLMTSGLEWILSDNMRLVLLQSQYRADPPLVSWGLDLAQYSWLPQLLAAATIVLEVGYPLALFSRRARWIIVPAVFSMQVGIRVLMGPWFATFLICNLFWIPWNRVSRGFARGFHKLRTRVAEAR